LVNQKAVEIVYTLQMEIWRLEKEVVNYTSTATIYKYKNRIVELQEKADKLRKQMVYFSDMKPYENKNAVGDIFFRRQKRICSSILEYNVAVLNYDPDKVEQCFYPTFTALNKYYCDDKEDYNPMLPFYTALDYNFRICPMPLVQVSTVKDSPYKTANFIDEIYTLQPLGLIDCINKFCDKYEHHLDKTIHYMYDHTAIGRNPLKTTYQLSVETALEARGWNVVKHFIGDAPDHDVKFNMIKQLLTEIGENAIRVNEYSCHQMISSIEQSPAIIVKGRTMKDKSTERNRNFPAEESTHFSDAFDMILWGLFEYSIINKESGFKTPMRVR
jgi:hypothetical protein